MKRLAIAALAAGWLVSFAAAGADPEVARLLERAEFWSERARDDLAREELAKVFRLAPDNAEALTQLARIQLRANQDRDAAATLERLRAAYPSHPGVAQISALLRVRGPDRDKLREARQLARAGRSDEAVRVWRQMFPDGVPDDDLALEYAQVLAATRAGREAGATLIAELARRHPNDPRYQVALAADQSTRRPVAPATLRALRELSGVASVQRQALDAWRRALLAMDPLEENIAPLREYVSLHPGDTAIEEKLDQVVKGAATERKVRDDPGYRARREGVAALEAGRLDEAEPLIDRALEMHPRDAEAIGAKGLLRLRQGRHAEAVEQFRRARELDAANAARWTSLERTSRYWSLVQQAQAARAQGNLEAALASANEAMSLDPGNAAAKAEAARIHLAAGREAEAEKLLADVPADQRASVEGSIRATRASRMRDEARALRDNGKTDEAFALLEKAHALDPESPWIVHDLARIHADRGDPAGGQALFGPLRARRPDDPDVRYAKALYLASIDRDALALALIDGIPPAQRSDGVKRLRVRLTLVGQAREAEAAAKSGNTAEAEQLVAAMRAAAANDVELALEAARAFDRLDRPADVRAMLNRVAALGGGTTPGEREEVARLERTLVHREASSLLEASRAAERSHDIDRAVELDRRALALEPSAETWRMRRLGELRDQQLSWIGGALDALHRSGTKGQSQLDAQELSFGYRGAWTAQGRPFFRVAPAHVSSGDLDFGNSYDVHTYGALLLCQPNCTGPAPDSRDNGVALAAGTQLNDLRLDIGTTPIGFRVVNLVGGAIYDGTLGPMSYSIDVSRRSVVSSLLSYAGARDPYTGRTWGGVVANGARVNVSRDSGGDYGAWGLAGWYRLTGRNVQDNDKTEVMAGFYRRFINEDNRQLAAGLTGMLWWFSEDAGEFTFGHGGYYSPKTYQSLALPVTFAMRTDEISFYARASVSVSRSESHRAPYYPTDAALQAQAEALAATNGIDPFYPASNNGRSYGRSFAMAAERRLAPDLFIGARIDIERSTNYTPSRLLLYVRQSLGGAPQRPIAMPPQAVVLPGFQY